MPVPERVPSRPMRKAIITVDTLINAVARIEFLEDANAMKNHVLWGPIIDDAYLPTVFTFIDQIKSYCDYVRKMVPNADGVEGQSLKKSTDRDWLVITADHLVRVVETVMIMSDEELRLTKMVINCYDVVVEGDRALFSDLIDGIRHT